MDSSLNSQKNKGMGWRPHCCLPSAKYGQELKVTEFCKHREKEQVEQSANYPSPRGQSGSDTALASS